MRILTMADLEKTPTGPIREDQPIMMDAAPVKIRGEALDPVWWQGRQWAVTAFGIEARDGTYSIPAGRLAENLASHAWPVHITAKTWVDVEDFNTAWLVALAMHGVQANGKAVRDAIAEGYLPYDQ